MARGVNKVILVGRLGSDAEVRYTAGGTAVANFNVATNEPFRTAEGTWEERPEWHRIVVYDKLAERCGSFLNKGKLVYIEGKLRTRQWEDQQGTKRYTTEVVAKELQLLGGPGDAVGQSQSGQADYGRPARQAAEGSPLPEYLPPDPGGPDEDIPF
ncbi:MAG: single-stranded DNA-binding protein [Syntrophobacteraceae bacterium]|jgi:single-strand DNA-binding protein|nr:single-stranded DNA-binding protein [Syntrophobacteraceae bacterium]